MWMNNYGEVEIKPLFNTKISFILVTNVIQAVILDCYNFKDIWTYKELLDRT